MTQNSSQTTPQNFGCVQVPRNLEISIPSPDSDRVIAIRWADWKRLERSLADASAPPKDYSSLHSALFGFSGSAWLALIPLAITKDLPSWVFPSSVALAVASLFCGIFVVVLSRDQRNTRKTMMTALLDDVKEIGGRFTFGETTGQELTGSAVVDLPTRAASIR